jgi:H+/gluconate symporter-like permease
MLMHLAPVHGVRRGELLMAPAPAPVAAAEIAGIDTTKRFAATVAAATLNAAAAQMSKWRVRRGSDPIHNRS